MEELIFLIILEIINIKNIFLFKGIFSIFFVFLEYDCGNRLYDLGRYELVIFYYENVVKIKLDWVIGWLKLVDILSKL